MEGAGIPDGMFGYNTVPLNIGGFLLRFLAESRPSERNGSEREREREKKKKNCSIQVSLPIQG